MCQLWTNNTLKLHPVGDVACSHRVVWTKDHVLPEGLNTIVKIACCKQDVPLHHLVFSLLNIALQVLLPWHLDVFPVDLHLNCHILFATVVNIVVDLGTHLLQFWSEVAAPPHVARCEGEEELEGVESYLNDENFD